jgi:hypothetical protein
MLSQIQYRALQLSNNVNIFDRFNIELSYCLLGCSYAQSI